MKSLNNFIIEKLRINKETKTELRDVAHCSFANLDMKLWFESAQEEKKYNHLIKARKNKNDISSLKETKELRKLLIYWYLSITNGWLKGSTELKEEIIRRRLFDENELDAYVLSKYKKVSGFEETEKNIEEYLEANNIKYEKNEKD